MVNVQKKLSKKQRAYAIQLMHLAFLTLRSGALTRDLIKKGKGKRKRMRKAHEGIVAFGEALHNIPLDIIRNSMNFDFHKEMISSEIDACPVLEKFLKELNVIQFEVDHFHPK